MFYSLTGTLVHTDKDSIAVDCGGVAYACRVTLTTLNALGALGNKVTVYTHLNVRENAMELFGFASQVELATFKMLTSVTGIGPKIALGVLSYLSPEQIALSVAANDYKALTTAPGVGGKTAQRIVLELKDKVESSAIEQGITGTATPVIGNSRMAEAISALVVLGYGQAQAAGVLANAPAEATVQELIKYALKALAER